MQPCLHYIPAFLYIVEINQLAIFCWTHFFIPEYFVINLKLNNSSSFIARIYIIKLIKRINWKIQDSLSATSLTNCTFHYPYFRLYCYAQKHVKSIKAVTRPGEVAEKQRYKSIRRNKNQPKKFKVRNLHHSSPYHVSDHKAAVTVGVIMGVFLICWVPFFCVNIVAAFCKTCIGGQTFKILSWLGYSNSAFNPIIYSIFNKEFRDAFKRILTTRNPWCCRQEVGNIHPRNSDRFVTDYAAKNVVMMNSARSSAELEQVSAIWPKRTASALVCCMSSADAASLTTTYIPWDSVTVATTTIVEALPVVTEMETELV